MADSGALRVRRATLHKRGDHSVCTERCADLRRLQAAEAALDTPAAGREPLAVIVGALVDGLALGGVTDPRRSLGATALRAAEQIDSTGPSPALLRELRLVLRELAPPGDTQDGEQLDWVDLIGFKRMLRLLLAGLPVRTVPERLWPLHEAAREVIEKLRAGEAAGVRD